MKTYLGFVAVSVFLLSCTNTDRDNPNDERASNYKGKSSAEGLSSSVEAGEPSSSSGDEELSSSSEDVSSSSDEALSSSSAETGDSSSSSGEAESSSSVAPSSSSAEPSSSSALPSSSSEAESSSSVAPSSSSEVQEPINAGSPLSFTNADYTENGKKYYWLGTEPQVKKDWVIQNVESARCDVTIGTRGVRYEQSQDVWDINNPGKISICAKAVCNQESKTLECAEAEFVSNPSLSGTCEWAEMGETPVIALEDIISQIDISIQNNYGRCEENVYLSPDGVTSLWRAETANPPITGIKAYAKCSGSLIGGIACPEITKKIKNPKATGYIVDDRDGQAYQIVKIGEQTWMAENLNYDTTGSKCYNNSDSNCNTYGRLYDWSTAMDFFSTCSCDCSNLIQPKRKGICPSGWHIPSQAEWEVITETIGDAATGGKKLKAMSGWNDYNGASDNGTDDYGFSALPTKGAGTSSDSDFTILWSSSIKNSDPSTCYPYSSFISKNSFSWNISLPKNTLTSVRCVKD